MCCIQAGEHYSSPSAQLLGMLGVAGQDAASPMSAGTSRLNLCLRHTASPRCLRSTSGKGVTCSQAPGFLPCCLALAAAACLTPILNPRLVSPPPPRAFLSGFIVISHTRQGRDGKRGGGIQLGASSHNLCLTNLPPRGLRGAPSIPASPHPSSIPLAPRTLRRMAAKRGGGRERD